MRIVLIDGAAQSERDAVVSVYDRGFLYGDSVFETMRTYGGRVFALEEHLSRLARSAELVSLLLPVSLDVLAVEVERGVALRADRSPAAPPAPAGVEPDRESYVRLMVTRGSGPIGVDPALARSPLRVLLVEPLQPPSAAFYERGIDVVLFRNSRGADATVVAGAKVGNYLPSILAVREAKQRGAAEALVVDRHGSVLEGATSNLFMVSKGELVTPPESAGILPGITRKHVLSAARELGIRSAERAIDENELLNAEEAFVTSSIREVVPVVGVDGRRIGDGAPGSITRTLHREYRERAHGYSHGDREGFRPRLTD